MKTLKSITHKDTVVFEEAHLPLDTVGITQIRGDNRDSKIAGGKDTNATGKTVLMGAIADIIFASSPVTSGTRKARTGVLTNPKSEIRLDAYCKAEPTTFIKRRKGKTFEYECHEGDENTNVVLKGYSEQKIRNYFDITQDEFYTQWFIDSRRLSPLQIGTAATRLKFFSDMFRLDNIDESRKVFNSMLREARIKQAEHKVLVKELGEVGELPDVKEARAKFKELGKRIKKSETEYEAIRSELDKVTHLIAMRPQFKRYSAVAKHLGMELGNTKPVEKKLTSLIDDYKKNRKLKLRYATYQERMRDYLEMKKEFGKLPSVSELKKSIKKLSEEQSKIKENLRSLKESAGVAESAKDVSKALKNEGKKLIGFDPNAGAEQVQELRGLVSLLDDVRSSIKSGLKHGAECPVCKSKLRDQFSERLEKDLSKYKDELRSTSEKLRAAKEFDSLKEEQEKYEAAQKSLPKLKKKIAEAESALAKIEKRLEELQGKLDNATKLMHAKPEEVEKPKDTISDKRASQFSEVLRFIGLLEPIAKELDERGSSINAQSKELSKKLKRFTLSEDKDEYHKVKSVLDEYEYKRKARERLEAEIAEAEPFVEDVPILETMIKAYSNKGMKQIMIRMIAQRVEKMMNEYAPLVFPEPIKFEFDVSSATSFEIRATRKVNGVNVTSDVSTLSGAESRSFSQLTPLALLPSIPHERRLNLIFFDEPLTNMSEARKALFIQSYLPKVNKLIPHVIVTTTENEFIEGAHVYEVVKQNSKSRLEKIL